MDTVTGTRPPLTTKTCPPLEDLAAFLDGKLSEGERARIVAHLADCESCYAVFAGAARFQLEEEDEQSQRLEEAVAAVVPFRRRNPLPWIAAAALAALLLIGLALIPRLYHADEAMPVFASAELVPEGVLASDEATRWTEGVTRGDSGISDTYKAAEFLVGVYLVDFHLALSRKEAEQSQEIYNVLVSIRNNIKNFIVPPEEAGFFDRAQEQILAGKDPSTLAPEAAKAEARLTKALADAESPYLEFGKWVEAGRLSSHARQPAFFENDENHRFLRWLLRNAEKEELDAKVVQDLEQIRDLLDEAETPKLPYDGLARRFTSILRYYEAESRAGSSP